MSIPVNLPPNAIKPALALSLCLYGAVAWGTYQLMHSKQSPDLTQLDLGSATINLDLGQFVEDPVPLPQPEALAPEPEPELVPEPVPEPEPIPEPEPQVTPEPEPAPVAAPVPQVKPKERPLRKEHHHQRTEHRPEQRAERPPRERVAQADHRPKQMERAAAQPTQSGASQRVLILGKDQHPVLLRIKKAIDGNLLYPRKARLMRLEGVAVVQFTYTKERTLRKLRLLKGTGHRELDAAALDSIKRAVYAFPPVDHNFTLRLPIRFELT